MPKNAAHRRNGFQALGSGVVVDRRRTHSQSRVSTAIVVDKRPLIRESALRTRSIRRPVSRSSRWPRSTSISGSGDGNDVSLVIVSIAGNSNSEETRRTLRRTAEALPNIPSVVLSDSEDFQNILSILQSGPRGCISTTMTLDVAIEALWLVQAGGQFLPATCIIGLAGSDAERAVCAAAGRRNFTARQAEVVRALC